jgi:hypothetical protein
VAVTNNAPAVWEYQDGNTVTTGTTQLRFSYTKNDANVASILVRLLDSTGAQLATATVDVSGQGVGTTSSYAVNNLSNGSSPINVSAVNTTSVTVPAGGTATYTAPAGRFAVVLAGDAGVDVQVGGTAWPFSPNVVVGPGVTVTLSNPTATQATVTVYEIDQAQVSQLSLTVEFVERDSAGNALYTQSIGITDIPPLVIGQAGQITVQAVG